MCTSEGIELLLNGGYFGRHLGFRTLRCEEKISPYFFKKLMIFSSKIKWVFVFTKQNTRNYKWAYTMA